MGSRLEKGAQATLKRIEGHVFEGEEGEEYEGSKFGGFNDYFRRKKLKLQNLDAEIRSSSDSPLIFKRIVAHVNGYTQPSLNDLHHMIVSHGGGFMQYLDGKTTVTHIIAANLTPKKAVEFKRYRIVKPAWIVDSIKAGKTLPWENYRVLDEGVKQRLLGFDDGKVISQVNVQQRTYREQTDGSWYTSQVRSVAEGIDDDDGAQFPSSQSLNRMESYLPGSYSRQQHVTNTLRSPLADHKEPEPSNPESFGVSSSLEDALREVGGDGSDEKQSFSPSVNAPERTQEPIGRAPETVDSHILKKSPSSEGQLDISPVPSPTKARVVLTAEERNVLLLADPHIRKSSTANPDFLRQYYSESRLHHLSTWKADLKARLQQRAVDMSLSQKPPNRKSGSRRYVMHVDFDSFFCAVSLKNAPSFVNKPTVVAHGSGPGSEIASCNYPAREFGIRNGMWMKNALEKCPEIKVLPYDFPAYELASQAFYDAILDVGGIVQSVSVDEALVDISSLCIFAEAEIDPRVLPEDIRLQEKEKANEIARNLRAKIQESTGCAVSIGIGGNILLAKVALRRAKPAGQYLIKPEEVLEFIGDLEIQSLPGVAYSIGGKLEEIGIRLVKDVRNLTKERLITVLGPKTGEKIWDYSRGIDKIEVGEQAIRKSVSAEVNWGIRFISQSEAEEFVQNMCIELQKRLLDAGVKGRQITMKIMKRAADAPIDPPKHLGHGKCDTFNKSISLGVATNMSDIIGREAVSILRQFGFSPGELRGLGVQMTKLESIKPKVDGQPDGSQRRLMFNASSPGSKAFKQAIEGIDDPDSPKKPKATHTHPLRTVLGANTDGTNEKKPLNLTGTQFVIPTQLDPAVLAELPQDIRSRLLAQNKSNSSSRAQSPAKSRSQSPATFLEDPLPSQLDPEVFSALPEDMKSEVLGSYMSRHFNTRAQSLLPQSPRKVRTLPPSKKTTTPTKKRTGLLFRGRPSKTESSSTLTQSNFVKKAGSTHDSKTKEDDVESDSAPSDLDPSFLAALPEDVRAEVIAEHRRSRLVRRSGLDLASKPKKKLPIQDPSGLGQRKLRLPARPPKPTFTTQNLSALPELRETLSEWHREFAKEGPHRDDVAAMERYLRRVTCEEKDVGKAVAVCKWLDWLIDEVEGKDSARGREKWAKALHGMKEVVQDAVRERGRGRVEF